MIIRVRNLLDKESPLTYLSNAETSSGTTLRVRNINAFEASWAVQIGKTGEEKSEIKVLGTATPSGTALNTTAGLSYDHPADTPVYAIKYDQIIYKVSTSGTAGTATSITNGTISIQPDQEYTQFDHTAGASTYAYKTQYRMSVLGSVSAESDWFIPTGFTFYSLGKIRERVKRKLYSDNYIKEDEVIDDWINEWLFEMNNVAIDVNKDYSIGTVDVGYSGTAELGTITESDFKEIRRVWFSSDGDSWHNATKTELTKFLPNQTFNDTQPFFYMQGDNIIGRKPADSSGTARITYYKHPTVLDDDTDEIPLVMKSYTKSFVDYALSQAYYLDGKKKEGDRYFNFAQNALDKFKKEIAPRSKSGVTYISEVEPVNEEDYEYF